MFGGQGLSTLLVPLLVGWVLNDKIDKVDKQDTPTIAFEAVSQCTVDATSKGGGVYKLVVSATGTAATFKMTVGGSRFAVPHIIPQGTAVDINFTSIDDTTRIITVALESSVASTAYTYWVTSK